MADKKEYRNYEIKHVVHAIIAEQIVAESFEKAMEKAKETLEGDIFKKPIEVIDERTIFCGYDDITAWDEVQN